MPSTCVPITWSHHTANSCVSMKVRTNGRSREGMASNRDPCVQQPQIRIQISHTSSRDPLPSEQVRHADPDPDFLYNSYTKVPPPSCIPILLTVTFMRMPAFLPRLTLVMMWGLRSPTSEARCVRSTWAIWEDAPRSSWWGGGGGGGGRK